MCWWLQHWRVETGRSGSSLDSQPSPNFKLWVQLERACYQGNKGESNSKVAAGLPNVQQESAHLHIWGHGLLPSTRALNKKGTWMKCLQGKEQCLTVFLMGKEFLEVDAKGGDQIEKWLKKRVRNFTKIAKTNMKYKKKSLFSRRV